MTRTDRSGWPTRPIPTPSPDGASGCACPTSGCRGSRPSSTPARARRRSTPSTSRSSSATARRGCRYSVHPWQRSDEDSVGRGVAGRSTGAWSAARPGTARSASSCRWTIEPRRAATLTAEMTLSRRDEMGFRMLVGREALRGLPRRPGPVLPRRTAAAAQPAQEPGPAEWRARPSRSAVSGSGPGTARAVALPITRLVTGAEVDLPVRVVHGREDGPTVWVDAAIHGDEAVGVEVVRQVLAGLDPKTFRGTLDRGPDRQRARLHDRRPLPARPSRPQPVVPRLGARLAGRAGSRT